MNRMTKADILVIGDINIDYLGMVPFFPEPDEEVAMDPLDSYLGGSGANFSVIANRLGMTTSFYSAVGNDTLGSSLCRQIEENGVSVDRVKVVDGIATGLVFGAVEKSGIRRLFCYRGANLHLYPADISDQTISSVKWLHLNGPGFSIATDLLKRARALNIRTSIDPGSILIEEHNIDDLLGFTDVLFLNEVEFRTLAKGKSYIEKANDLHQKGADWIVLKHQAEGCVLFRKGQRPIIQEAFKIEAVDSTGAGDAYNAGLIYGILHDYELPEALTLANAVGALTAMAIGATTGVPGTLDEINEFILRTDLCSSQIALLNPMNGR